MSRKYHPNESNSSYLSLLSVALQIQYINRMINKSNIFKLYNIIIKSTNMIKEKYSDNIIIEKYRLLNSVINPATNSLSASGKSKGTLFDSTRIHRLKVINKNKGTQ